MLIPSQCVPFIFWSFVSTCHTSGVSSIQLPLSHVLYNSSTKSCAICHVLTTQETLSLSMCSTLLWKFRRVHTILGVSPSAWTSNLMVPWFLCLTLPFTVFLARHSINVLKFCLFTSAFCFLHILYCFAGTALLACTETIVKHTWCMQYIHMHMFKNHGQTFAVHRLKGTWDWWWMARQVLYQSLLGPHWLDMFVFLL